MKRSSPVLCMALAQALESAGRSKAEAARTIRTDRQQIHRWTTTAEPPNHILGQIEQWLGLPRGQLYIDAGLVDLPKTDVEAAIAADNQLTPIAKRIALAQVETLRKLSAEELAGGRPSRAAAASNNAPQLMASFSSSLI